MDAQLGMLEAWKIAEKQIRRSAPDEQISYV